MIVCPKCGKELADGTKFCSKCGEAIKAAPAAAETAEAMVTCPKCGKQVKAGMKFCVSCGTPLSNAGGQAAEQKASAEQASPAGQAAEQKASAEQASPAGQAAEQKVSVEQTAPASQAAPQQAAEQKTPVEQAPASQASPASQAVPQQATEQKAPAQQAAAPQTESKKEETKKDEEKKSGLFANNTVKFACIGLAAILVLILLGSLLSGGGSGGKHYAMYFKDKEIMYTGMSAKSNWQVTTKMIKEGNIDNSLLAQANASSNICKLSEDGKLLIFPDKMAATDEELTLYYRYVNNQKKEPEKIDSSVDSYELNKAGSLVTYAKSSDDLYQYNLKKGEKEKISSEVASYKVSEDGSKVYYCKNSGELYLWAKKNSEKLDSDIKRIVYVTKDFKSVYYLKDGALYKKDGTKDKEKISADVDRVIKVFDSGEIYYTKEDSGSKMLYYFDGKNAEKISENYQGFYATATDAETAVLVYSAKDSDDTKDVLFYVALKKEVTELEQTDVARAYVDPKGKFLYFIADLNSDKDAGDLYRAAISGSKVNKPERYNTDVSLNGQCGLTEDGQIVYFKDFSRNKGDLYCEKKKLDSDVYGSLVTYCKSSKDLVYYVDYDSDKRMGTLKIADSKSAKPKKIADDASQYAVASNGYVLYLYDYSTKSYKGELYLYKGSGKPVKLDDEVTAIIQIN